MSFQPSNMEVCSEKSPPVILHGPLSWPPPVGFVCSDGRHLDRNYQRARPPCPGSVGQAARGAPSCQTPASLSRTEVRRLRPTLLFEQPGGRFLLEALHNTRGKVLRQGLMAAVVVLPAAECSDAMVTARLS